MRMAMAGAIRHETRFQADGRRRGARSPITRCGPLPSSPSAGGKRSTTSGSCPNDVSGRIGRRRTMSNAHTWARSRDDAERRTYGGVNCVVKPPMPRPSLRTTVAGGMSLRSCLDPGTSRYPRRSAGGPRSCRARDGIRLPSFHRKWPPRVSSSLISSPQIRKAVGGGETLRLQRDLGGGITSGASPLSSPVPQTQLRWAPQDGLRPRRTPRQWPVSSGGGVLFGDAAQTK